MSVRLPAEGPARRYVGINRRRWVAGAMFADDVQRQTRVENQSEADDHDGDDDDVGRKRSWVPLSLSRADRCQDWASSPRSAHVITCPFDFGINTTKRDMY